MKSWRREDGTVIPLEECTREQLIDRFRYVGERHSDERAAWVGKEKALMKRLQDARKAKQLANRRADVAVKAMRDMLETFES